MAQIMRRYTLYAHWQAFWVIFADIVIFITVFYIQIEQITLPHLFKTAFGVHFAAGINTNIH